MNRLTERLPNGVVRVPVTDENRGDSCMMRLAAYEDLGTVEELAALKERTKWVPVSERMPEEVSSYLVVYHEWSNGDFLPKYDDLTVRVMRFMNNGKWRFPVCTDKRCETDTNREITHWMPLPSVPDSEAANGN